MSYCRIESLGKGIHKSQKLLSVLDKEAGNQALDGMVVEVLRSTQVTIKQTLSLVMFHDENIGLIYYHYLIGSYSVVSIGCPCHSFSSWGLGVHCCGGPKAFSGGNDRC